MRNRIAGIMIIGVAALMGFIIFSFNTAMTDIVNTSCSHGTSCPMWGSISFSTNLSIGITAFVVIIGLYLAFFGEEERIITRIKRIAQQIEPRRITKGNYKKVMNGLGNDEKKVLGEVIDAQGSMLQADIVEKTNFAKVKVSRLLDKLEGKGLVERRRRGMSNIVVLKH